MRRSTIGLIALLVGSNAAWLIARPSGEGAGEWSRVELEGPKAPPGGGTGVASSRSAGGGTLEPAAGGPGPIATPQLARAVDPAALEAIAEEAGHQKRVRDAQKQRAWELVRTWRSDVLQQHDLPRRDAGLAGMRAAILSQDTALVAAALDSLGHFRHSAFPWAELRGAIRARLADPDRTLRRAAARALPVAAPEASDVDALLDVLQSHPNDLWALGAAVTIARRVEGRLADAWLAALERTPPKESIGLVRLLGPAWVSQEVEAAAVRACRGAGGGWDWYQCLGTFVPTREVRVRWVFEELRRQGQQAHPLNTGPILKALDRHKVDPPAARLAVRLALEMLDEPPDADAVSACLEVIRHCGTAEDAPAVRAYAENAMVAGGTRKVAQSLASQLERRR